jgi:hypothetical protein
VVCRRHQRGDFDALPGTTLQLLLPHLASALDLHHRLRTAEGSSQGLARVFDQLENRTILVDAAAQPVLVNRRAAAIPARCAITSSGPSRRLARTAKPRWRRWRAVSLSRGARPAIP